MNTADKRTRTGPETGTQSGRCRHRHQHRHRHRHHYHEKPLNQKHKHELPHRPLHVKHEDDKEEKMNTGLLDKLSLIFGAERKLRPEASPRTLSFVKLDPSQQPIHKHKHKHLQAHRNHPHTHTHSYTAQKSKDKDKIISEKSENQHVNADAINVKELNDQIEINADAEIEQKKGNVDDIRDTKSEPESEDTNKQDIRSESSNPEVSIFKIDDSDGYESDTESDASENDVEIQSPTEIARGWHRLVSMKSSEVNEALDGIKLQNQSALDYKDTSMESVASSSEHDEDDPDATNVEYKSPTEIARGWHRLVSQDSEIYELTFEPLPKPEILPRRADVSDNDIESISDLSEEEKIPIKSAFFQPIQEDVSLFNETPKNLKAKPEDGTLSKTNKRMLDEAKLKYKVGTPLVDDEIKQLAGEVKKDVNEVKNSFEKVIKFFIPPVALIPITLVFMSIIGALKMANRITVAGIRGITFIVPKIYHGIVQFHKRQFRGLLKMIIYWYMSLSKVIHLTARGTGRSIVWIFRTTKRGHKALVRYTTLSVMVAAKSIQRSSQSILYLVTENAFKPLLALLRLFKKTVTMPFWGGRYFVKAIRRIVKNARDNREEFIDLAVAVIGLLIIALIATGRLFPFFYDIITGQTGVDVNYYVVELPTFQMYFPSFGRSKPRLLSRLSFGLL